jgi:hypothetical protein
MPPSNFRPESEAARIEDTFLKEGTAKWENDRLSESFLEGKLTSTEGSIDDAFLRDAEQVVPRERESASEAQIVQNKEDGCRRENEVSASLSREYPESDGYRVLPERYLLDQSGRFVSDPQTGERRRIDFTVVDSDFNACRSIEVTSPTAPKDEQTAKESRIRQAGGHFVRDPDSGRLIDVSSTPTEILRLP